MTPTDIANQALGIIGHDPISSLEDTDIDGNFTDASETANKCRIFYASERDACFRDHHWNFAIRRKVLARNTTAPVDKYTYAYARDVDDLRAISINEDDPDAAWQVEGRNIVTDETAVTLKYIHRITDPNEWDALFVSAFVLRLAAKLALSISHDAAYSLKLMEQYFLLYGDARAVDGQEGSVEVYEVPTLIDVRRG